jgi:hypothetical protein
MPSYPQVTLSTLEALYRLGKIICDEIEKFHPDIVIGLAHSGWMPIVVAQALWADTRKTPFPASMRTNIGQEKHELYHARYGKSRPAFCCGECNWGEPGRLGHYLAWVAEQSIWQKTLRRQIKQVLPSEPKRILVADDIFGGYRSGYATLALLEALYPNAEIYMYAGHNDLTDNFVTGWLEEFIPPLANEILERGVNPNFVRYSSPWHETLKPLINGTEDITADSLDWKFITRDSPAVKAVEEHIPAEVALSAPEWARNLAVSYALQRSRGEIEQETIIEPEEDMAHFVPRDILAIQLEERLAARAWKQGGVTDADIVQIYGEHLSQLKKGMRTVRDRGEWQAHGERPNAIYLPDGVCDTWINIYPPTEQSPTPDFPVLGFEEFLPGQVWAGVYPRLYNNLEAVFFKDMLLAGINSFVDLTNSRDLYRKIPYRKTLIKVSRETGRRVEIKNYSLPFRSNPTKSQVERVIRHIDRELKAGRRVFVHAGYNLDGRAPLILACLLIERGCSAKKALAKVNAFWMKMLHYLICPPLSGAQEQFVLNWKAER